MTNQANPAPADLQTGWQQIAATITTWRQTAGLDKPVLMTELGYRSAAGSNMQFSAPASTQPAPTSSKRRCKRR